MEDSVHDIVDFLVWPLPETAMVVVYYVSASWVPCRIPGIRYTLRDAIIALMRG